MTVTLKRFPKVTPQNAWKLDVDRTLAESDSLEEGDDPTVEVFIPHPDLFFEDAEATEFYDADTGVWNRDE